LRLEDVDYLLVAGESVLPRWFARLECGAGQVDLHVGDRPPSARGLLVLRRVRHVANRQGAQAGGDLTVTFTAKGLEPTFANGYWTYYGIVGAYLQIQQMTPVPYHIPSALPKIGLDLPLCKKGQKSTKARPCL